MKKTPRSIPAKRRFLTIILIIAIIAGAMTLLLLKNFKFDNKKTALVESSPESATSPTSTPLPLPPSALEPDLPQEPPAEPSSPAPNASTFEEKSQCQDIAAKLHSFFTHLDQQPYIKAYTQGETAETELSRIIAKLLNTPPINSNETADLLSVIRNSSHLFRVLGRKDLSFLKDIITNEHPSIEQHLATLYAWSKMDKKCRDSSAIRLEFPLEKTYEYSAFFLNTLGGHSYLSRRDTTVRTLTKYYCVLILHQAVEQELNRHSIDLGYHLDSVIDDIKNSDFLENQNSYLATLQHIKSTWRNNQKP